MLGCYDHLHNGSASRSAKVDGISGDFEHRRNSAQTVSALTKLSKAGVISRLAVNGELHPRLIDRHECGPVNSGVPHWILLHRGPPRLFGTRKLYHRCPAKSRRGLRQVTSTHRPSTQQKLEPFSLGARPDRVWVGGFREIWCARNLTLGSRCREELYRLPVDHF